MFYTVQIHFSTKESKLHEIRIKKQVFKFSSSVKNELVFRKKNKKKVALKKQNIIKIFVNFILESKK